jgi:hypothetical protein
MGEEGEFILRQMTHAVLWQGRYPVPKQQDAWKAIADTQKRRMLQGRISQADQSKITEIYEKLTSLARKEMKALDRRKDDRSQSIYQ